MRKFLLAILVDNKPGVLTHVAGLISRRAFNIESINAGYTEEESVTRINIVVSVDSEWELEQVKHQLSKLIDVVKIVNLTEVDNITRRRPVPTSSTSSISSGRKSWTCRRKMSSLS